ncbi:MAG TPA: dienelactone hydrolase family protein [Thermohalobaculum sp.]|nr:dienelactone hydrolase family protein [Thermohalobaculum sp.]
MSLTGPRRDARSGHARSLVVFLHGYGADGNDLIGLADPLAPHLPDTAFLAPNAPERNAVNPGGCQWFPIPWIDGSSEDARAESYRRSVGILDGWLTEAMEAEGIPPVRTAVVGFSQGTMMALSVLPARAEPVACLVGFSGRLLDPEALRTARSKPPVLLVHGDRDEMVPVASLDEAKRALEGAGFDVLAHVSRGMAHGIAPDGLEVALAFLMTHLGYAE